MGTGAHSDQLSRYRSALHEEFDEVLPVFLRTGDQSDYEHAQEEGYEPFPREVKVLDRGAERGHALGLSQQRLGEQCGLPQEYISGIERRARNPTLKTIWTLAEGLETSPGDLLLEAEEIMDSEM